MSKSVCHIPGSNGKTMCGKPLNFSDVTGWTRAMITCPKCKKSQKYKEFK